MAQRIAILSTYPATQCGIATFCEALAAQLLADGADVGVVRLVDAPEPERPPVVHEWLPGGDPAAVAAVLDRYDVVVVQHEYGIFGGPDGQDVLDVVARVHVPVITVTHTVLTHPSPNQRRVLARLLDLSAAVVTMTRTARDRLVAGWGVDPRSVSVIPHGAVDNRSAPTAPAGARPVVLSWGLLSPGKGIEWALLALAELRERTALPLYRVVGQTHPRVRERHGEAYRDSLLALTRDLDLTDCVDFDARYLSGDDLRAVVRGSDVVVLPYDSVEQVTSGVLTEAVAAGRPVISTRFPHAVELLSEGAGVLVPQRDATALADALEHVLSDDGVAARMAATSHATASAFMWPVVSRRYLELAAVLRVAALERAV